MLHTTQAVLSALKSATAPMTAAEIARRTRLRVSMVENDLGDLDMEGYAEFSQETNMWSLSSDGRSYKIIEYPKSRGGGFGRGFSGSRGGSGSSFSGMVSSAAASSINL